MAVIRHLSEPALRGLAEPSCVDRRRARPTPWTRDASPRKGAATSSGTCTPASSDCSLESLSDHGAPRRRQRLPSGSDPVPTCLQLALSMAALRLKDQQRQLNSSKRYSSLGASRCCSLRRAGGLALRSPERDQPRATAREFHVFDADADGRLSRGEFMAWLRGELRWGSPRSSDPLSAHRRADFMQREFEKADRDGNKRISLEEFAHYRENFRSSLQAVQHSGFPEGFREKSRSNSMCEA